MGSVNKFTFFKEVIRDTSLTESARLIAIAIANYSDAQGLNSRPGNKKLAEELGVHRNTVISGIKSLISRGWIVRARKGNGRGNASVYHLNLPVDKLVDMSVDSEIKGTAGATLSEIKGTTGSAKRIQPVVPHQINDHMYARARTARRDVDPQAKRANLWRAICQRRGLSPSYEQTQTVLANWPNDEMRQSNYLAEKTSEIEEIENINGGGAVVYQFPKSN